MGENVKGQVRTGGVLKVTIQRQFEPAQTIKI